MECVRVPGYNTHALRTITYYHWVPTLGLLRSRPLLRYYQYTVDTIENPVTVIVYNAIHFLRWWNQNVTYQSKGLVTV